ncbi:hypothetical protein JG688_00017723, partial [Phytophthora aleatoria]
STALSQTYSQASLVPLDELDQPATPLLTSSSVVDLTVASTASPLSSSFSSSSSEVDAFGIPLDIGHYRQQNCRHDVWDIMYRLETPYTKTTGHDT